MALTVCKLSNDTKGAITVSTEAVVTTWREANAIRKRIFDLGGTPVVYDAGELVAYGWHKGP
jgi:hypothetical protein